MHFGLFLFKAFGQLFSLRIIWLADLAAMEILNFFQLFLELPILSFDFVE